MRNELAKRIFSGLVAFEVAVGTACAGTESAPAVSSPTTPWESQLALSTSNLEDGCSGRYTLTIREDLLNRQIGDIKELSKKLKLEIDLRPITSSSVNAVAQILEADKVRARLETVIDTPFNI